MRLAVPLVLLAGCGGGSAPATTPVAPLAPLVNRPPPLPSGWTHFRDPAQRLSFGVPPGWTARRSGGSVEVRSADRALALTVAVDRKADGAAPAAYVAATLRALGGYAGLRARPARAVVDAPYPAASASATGTLRSTGVRQRIVAIALEPVSGTICSVLAFASANTARGRYVAPLAGLVRTVFVR